MSILCSSQFRDLLALPTGQRFASASYNKNRNFFGTRDEFEISVILALIVLCLLSLRSTRWIRHDRNQNVVKWLLTARLFATQAFVWRVRY